MEQVYGIQETKDVIDAGLALGSAYKTAMADGKLGVEDAMLLVPVFPKLAAAAANIEAVPKELGELSADEAKQIVDYVASKVGESKAEKVAVKALKLGLSLVDLVAEVKA